MEKNQMKNIIILKNLPSNLVEEAIVILKTNKSAKKIEYIEKKENSQKINSSKDTKNYIVREAESVLSNYIKSIENKENISKEKNSDKINKKIKIYAIAVTIAFVISLII